MSMIPLTERLSASPAVARSQAFELKPPTFAIVGKTADGVEVRVVPALKYTNPNGRDFVKFDAVDVDNPTVLIDRKLNVALKRNGTPMTDQGDAFRRQGKALKEPGNEAYTVRYEVPNEEVAEKLRELAGLYLPEGRFEVKVLEP